MPVTRSVCIRRESDERHFYCVNTNIVLFFVFVLGLSVYDRRLSIECDTGDKQLAIKCFATLNDIRTPTRPFKM